MKTGSSRGMPTRVKVALLGAVLALGALGLPWMGSSLAAIPHLMGYQDSVIWTGLRVIAALATVVLGLQLVKVPELRETQRAVFGASAVVFVLRPITLVVTNPTSSDLSSGGVQLDRVFTPSWGIFASFLAGALMVAATVMTHRSDDVREAAEREAARAALLEDPELAAFAGPPPAPIVVPSAPAPVVAQPEPVLAAEPEPAAYAEPEPAVYAEPEPAVYAQPEPAVYAQPEPATYAQPQPAVYAQPEPASYAQPQPTIHAQPEPVVYAQPQPSAYAQPKPAVYVPPVPVAREDTGPYGPDGPSRLGEGPNLVQLDDALAPKHAAPAPHLALMQQPPLHEAPVRPEPQIATAQAAPAPTPPAPGAPAEPRQRSVAPPGFG